MSLRYRPEYAAAIPRGLHGQQGQTAREVPHPKAGTHRARPTSARFEPVKD